MCITPVTIKRDYKRTAQEVKNGYTTLTDNVPCGKCHICLANRRNSWAFRLWKQMDVSESCVFMTLTYKDEPQTPNGHGTLQKSDVQKFFKKLRKRTGKKLKYFYVGEYGGTFLRPHYHIILYNLPKRYIIDPLFVQEKIWKLGIVDIVPANMPTIFYTVGYIMKGKFEPLHEVDEQTGEIICEDDRQPEFANMSKNLGLCYLTDTIWNWHVDTLSGFVTAQNGSIMNMPRYYKDKVFSKDEKREMKKETDLIHAMDWLQFANHDFAMEVQKKQNSTRRHEKQQKLKRLKL